MVREMSFEEVVYVAEGIKRCLDLGTPIKTPLQEVTKQLNIIISEFEKEKENLAQKYLKKNSEGRFIKKPTVKKPTTITDYESDSEEELVKELLKSVEKSYKIDFTTVPSNKKILINLGESGYKEIELKDYLELSPSVDAKVALFLNQYFIHD